MQKSTLSSYIAQSRARQFIRRGLPLLGIVLIVAGIFSSRIWWMPLLAPKQVDPTASAGDVAAAAVSEFYTFHYSEGMDRWAGRVCDLSTADGCQITKNLYGPLFWEGVLKNRVTTDAVAVPVEVVHEENIGLVEAQLWRLDVTLSDPWEGVEPTQTVYAQVIRETNLKPWQFVRILFHQEVVNLTGMDQGDGK